MAITRKQRDTERARQWHEAEKVRRNNILQQQQQQQLAQQPSQPVRASAAPYQQVHLPDALQNRHGHRHHQQQPAAAIRRSSHANPAASANVVAERERADRANARAYYDEVLRRQDERQQEQHHLHHLHHHAPSYVPTPAQQAYDNTKKTPSQNNETSLTEVAALVLAEVVGTAFTVVAMLLYFIFELALKAWRRSWRKSHK